MAYIRAYIAQRVRELEDCRWAAAREFLRYDRTLGSSRKSRAASEESPGNRYSTLPFLGEVTIESSEDCGSNRSLLDLGAGGAALHGLRTEGLCKRFHFGVQSARALA
jgi:hypothetical protein